MDGPVLFGVRHLSPAAAFHLERALEACRPQLVLVEGKRAPDGRQQGQTGTGIQVRIDRAAPARGLLLPVRILAAGEDWLEGTVLEGEIPMEKG